MNQILVDWRTCELLDYHIVDALGQKNEYMHSNVKKNRA